MGRVAPAALPQRLLAPLRLEHAPLRTTFRGSPARIVAGLLSVSGKFRLSAAKVTETAAFNDNLLLSTTIDDFD